MVRSASYPSPPSLPLSHTHIHTHTHLHPLLTGLQCQHPVTLPSVCCYAHHTHTHTHTKALGYTSPVCVSMYECVCVCERERERERACETLCSTTHHITGLVHGVTVSQCHGVTVSQGVVPSPVHYPSTLTKKGGPRPKSKQHRDHQIPVYKYVITGSVGDW